MSESPRARRRDARDRVHPFRRTAAWRQLYMLARRFFYVALRPLMRLEVRGRERVPRTGAVVICCNHLHNFDPLVVGAVIPRPILYMAKKELFPVPLIGGFIALFGAFPVDRGAADRAALRYAVHAVEEGFALLMFPEGTRSLSGKIERVLPGAAFVALRTGAPVLPVAVTGTQVLPFDEKAAGRRQKPEGSGEEDGGQHGTSALPFLRKRRARVTVTFGDFFTLPKERDGKRLSVEAATDEMMRRVAALLPPEYRGIYADPQSAVSDQQAAGSDER